MRELASPRRTSSQLVYALAKRSAIVTGLPLANRGARFPIVYNSTVAIVVGVAVEKG